MGLGQIGQSISGVQLPAGNIRREFGHVRLRAKYSLFLTLMVLELSPLIIHGEDHKQNCFPQTIDTKWKKNIIEIRLNIHWKQSIANTYG